MLNQPGRYARHPRARGDIFDHRRTSGNHRAGANGDTWAKHRARANQGTRANAYPTGQNCAGADMRGFFHNAIMFHNRAGIDEGECANLGLRPDHGTGEDGGAIPDPCTMAD